MKKCCQENEEKIDRKNLGWQISQSGKKGKTHGQSLTDETGLELDKTGNTDPGFAQIVQQQKWWVREEGGRVVFVFCVCVVGGNMGDKEGL